MKPATEPPNTQRNNRACNVCRDKGHDIARGPALAPTTTTSDGDTEPSDASSDASAAATAAAASDEFACLAYMHSECPLNRRELGRASWAYLHTLAAYYPDAPTKAQKDDMRSFITAYARWYPCGYCADRTRDEMIRNPPKLESQKEFAFWMCEIHNEVNDRMGKDLFDCELVQQRWKTGPKDGSCQ